RDRLAPGGDPLPHHGGVAALEGPGADFPGEPRAERRPPVRAAVEQLVVHIPLDAERRQRPGPAVVMVGGAAPPGPELPAVGSGPEPLGIPVAPCIASRADDAHLATIPGPPAADPRRGTVEVQE